MRLACVIFGHDVRVRYFFNSRLKMQGHQKREVCAVAVCQRCQKELSPPANPPRRTA